MNHYWSLEQVKIENAILTIGTFDGVHLGHRKVIEQVVQKAQSQMAKSVVLTFFPHPAIVLSKRATPAYLTTPIERAKILGNLGVDIVVTYPFTVFTAKKDPATFIQQITNHIQFRELVVGHDFALGRNRTGDITTLSQLGKKFGFAVSSIEPYIHEGEIVSSSKIRALLASGDIEKANTLLGRAFTLEGIVVKGDNRASRLGTPTANIDIWKDYATLKNGVYATKVEINNKVYNAVTNIGVRPTFEPNQTLPRIEAHILDFNQDIYNALARISFITRLRDEIKFNSANELKQQIMEDIQLARIVLT